MTKKLLPVLFMMISVVVTAQEEFFFTSVETTGTTQDLDFETTEPAEDGFGDHTDMEIIINPEIDNFEDIAFLLSFTQDAYVKLIVEVPVVGSLPIYTSEGTVESPLTATSGLLSALDLAPDGEYGLIVVGSTTEEDPTAEPDPNDPGKEVLKFTVVIDRTLGIDDMDLNAFSYYPNPMENQLNLEAASDIDHLVLYNILGQEVMNKTPNRKETQINTSGLKAGVYIMKVNVDGHQKSFKVVKN
ncbi:MAG: T9SS type A sorting domain-containing protein [Psychroflexus sp.]|nr:T9SS type A sorting domain-containing protein [Psychroflexus sp.]MDN6309643.1 T9SS type A sorting domain-containing protein [Psychroflexus sp.]